MMPEKIQVPADFEEICDAFGDSSVNHRYYLDLKAGDIIFITKGKEESEEQIDEWFAGCCIAIPKLSSSDGYEDMEYFIESIEDEGIELVKAKPIEIMEVSPRELSYSKEIEASWKGFGPIACLKCGNEEIFEEKHFILSRCSNSKEEEEWLDGTMKKQYGVEQYEIAAGVFGDNRGFIEFAVCRKCRSQDVFFDF